MGMAASLFLCTLCFFSTKENIVKFLIIPKETRNLGIETENKTDSKIIIVSVKEL